MKILTVAAVIVAMAALFWWWSESLQQEPNVADVPMKVPEQHDETGSTAVWKGHKFELDPNRLYEKSYENDPGVIAMAKALEITPQCLIALGKSVDDGISVPAGVCDKHADANEIALPRPGEPTSYDQYTNAQLEGYATSDPVAAVVLARRLEDDEESRFYYERAVVLTGSPQPLMEWLHYRNTGVMHYDADGKLTDIKKAKTGYETYLIAAAFGMDGGIAAWYAEELRKAGVDPTSVRQSAQARINELRRQREAFAPNTSEGGAA